MRAGRRSDENISVRKIKSRGVKIENDKNLTLRDKRAWREWTAKNVRKKDDQQNRKDFMKRFVPKKY